MTDFVRYVVGLQPSLYIGIKRAEAQLRTWINYDDCVPDARRPFSDTFGSFRFPVPTIKPPDWRA
jgi:hypothetical protein